MWTTAKLLALPLNLGVSWDCGPVLSAWQKVAFGLHFERLQFLMVSLIALRYTVKQYIMVEYVKTDNYLMNRTWKEWSYPTIPSEGIPPITQ